MNTSNNGGDAPNYYPNSFSGPEPEPMSAEPSYEVSGQVKRHDVDLSDDDFFQAGELYRRVMTDSDRENLIKNISSHLCNAEKRIQLRQAAVFYKADTGYGTRVAEKLQLSVDEVKKLAGMAQTERSNATKGK